MNRKTRMRAGLSFGITTGIFFAIQNILSTNTSSSKDMANGIISALAAGAIAGFLFAWLIGLFAKSKAVNESAKIETDEGESILFQTGANHFKGMEGVGGKLFLTNKRLIFKSHKFNIQNHQLQINLTDITNVSRRKTMGIINNGLMVTHHDKQEKFVVENAEEWMKQLEGSRHS